MRRRSFITLLSGSAAWPMAARAQQRDRMRRIGVLMPAGVDDAEYQTRNAIFLQGLQELGWTVGRNLEIAYRWATSDPNKLRQYATELVALAPDVIFTSAALEQTRTVRLRQCHRSGQYGHRRESRSARRQRDWIYAIRVQPQRKVARTAQANRTRCDTNWRPAKSFDHQYGTDRGNSGRSAAAWR
jgi:hypothetical protein